ncbi:hypothetical protein ALC57_09978, partial [Trachymyrmex cornetzi]
SVSMNKFSFKYRNVILGMTATAFGYYAVLMPHTVFLKKYRYMVATYQLDFAISNQATQFGNRDPFFAVFLPTSTATSSASTTTSASQTSTVTSTRAKTSTKTTTSGWSSVRHLNNSITFVENIVDKLFCTLLLYLHRIIKNYQEYKYTHVGSFLRVENLRRSRTIDELPFVQKEAPSERSRVGLFQRDACYFAIHDRLDIVARTVNGKRLRTALVRSLLTFGYSPTTSDGKSGPTSSGGDGDRSRRMFDGMFESPFSSRAQCAELPKLRQNTRPVDDANTANTANTAPSDKPRYVGDRVPHFSRERPGPYDQPKRREGEEKGRRVTDSDVQAPN